jgi:hypothetical protein
MPKNNGLQRRFFVNETVNLFRYVKNNCDDNNKQHRKKESAEKLPDNISV